MPEDPKNEAPRYEAESAFTPILRSLWRSFPSILCTVFIDDEGEYVDYCSSISAFEAKVAGAELLALAKRSGGTLLRLRAGTLHFLHVRGQRRELVFQEVDPEYGLVVVARTVEPFYPLLRSVERTAQLLQTEGRLRRQARRFGA